MLSKFNLTTTEVSKRDISNAIVTRGHCSYVVCVISELWINCETRYEIYCCCFKLWCKEIQSLDSMRVKTTHQQTGGNYCSGHYQKETVVCQSGKVNLSNLRVFEFSKSWRFVWSVERERLNKKKVVSKFWCHKIDNKEEKKNTSKLDEECMKNWINKLGNIEQMVKNKHNLIATFLLL